MTAKNPTYRDLKIGRFLLTKAVSQSGDGWERDGQKFSWFFMGDSFRGLPRSELRNFTILLGNLMFGVWWLAKSSSPELPGKD